MEFEHQVDLVKYLQGNWQRDDNKIAFTIENAFNVVPYMVDPSTIVPVGFGIMSINKNDVSGNWRLSGQVFGYLSDIVLLEDNLFVIEVNPNSVILPVYGMYNNPFRVTFNRNPLR